MKRQRFLCLNALWGQLEAGCQSLAVQAMGRVHPLCVYTDIDCACGAQVPMHTESIETGT